MASRYILYVILLATTAFGQWKRYSRLDFGGGSDSPPPHALAYFQADPCSRTGQEDRVAQCNEHPSAAELEHRRKTHTDLQVIGKIGALTVYDLYYYFPDVDPDRPGMRSILVGATRQQLHEIHVADNSPLGTLFPTEILHVGNQGILKVKADDGGNFHIVKPVFDAAKKAVPNHMVTYQPTSQFDFDAPLFRIQTEKRDVNIGPKVACCEGRVEVPFRIERGLVIAGQATYFPR